MWSVRSGWSVNTSLQSWASSDSPWQEYWISIRGVKERSRPRRRKTNQTRTREEKKKIREKGGGFLLACRPRGQKPRSHLSCFLSGFLSLPGKQPPRIFMKNWNVFQEQISFSLRVKLSSDSLDWTLTRCHHLLNLFISLPELTLEKLLSFRKGE